MDLSESPPRTQAFVLWIVWAAIFAGLFVFDSLLAPKNGASPPQPDAGLSAYALIGFGLAAISMIIRWLVIPRLQTLEKKLPLMVVGLAVAEAIGLMSLFALPADHASERTLLFSLSIACVVLSAPLYAKLSISSNDIADS